MLGLMQAFLWGRPKIPKKKTQKQVDRYVKEYGQGAIVYRHGFTGSLVQRGCNFTRREPFRFNST